MGRPGPAPKGDRTHTTVRLHHVPAYRAAASARGFADLNGYIDAVLAEYHGLPLPDGAQSPGGQLVLTPDQDDEEADAVA